MRPVLACSTLALALALAACAPGATDAAGRPLDDAVAHCRCRPHGGEAFRGKLAERTDAEEASRPFCASPTIIRISVYSDNLAILWRSVQDAFARAGLDVLRDYSCPTDAAGARVADSQCSSIW